MSFLFAKRRPLSALIAAAFVVTAALPTAATGETPKPSTSAGEELQPKFIWGLVLNLVFKFAMSAFSDWLGQKLTTDLSNNSKLERIMLNSAHAVVTPLASTAPFGAKSAGAQANTVPGEPNKEVKVENGRENYQGVHVAIVGFDKSGTVTGIQPVTTGFRSGDRVKLKILPTFEGIVVIENINPKGERRQIYPANASDVVRIKASSEIFLPLGRDEYFEFTGVTGEEQLVITIRDPRAFDNNASKAEPNRKDDSSGSSIVQETPGDTYPVISQSLKLKHDS